MNNDVRNNKIRSIVCGILRGCALLCATGTLMQTFLVTLGFSSSWIYIQTSLLQAANVLTIMLCSRWADKGNVIKRAAWVQLPAALLFLCYLPLCIARSSSIWSFVLLVAVSMVQSVTTGLYTVCEYKLPYYTYLANEFGSMNALGGILSSGVTFGVGIVMSKLSERYSYVTLMIFAFVIAAAFMGIAAIIGSHQKSLIKDETDENGAPKVHDKVPYSKVFKHPVFAKVWPAHLLRGFAYGTISVLAVTAADIGFDASVITAMVSVQAVASLLGCAVYGLSSKYISPRIPIFVGALTSMLLPMLMLADNTSFLLLYAVIIFGRTFIDYSVISLMLYAVPLELAGTYNAWRMILHNGGTFIATTIAAFIPTTALLVATVVCQLISGTMFLRIKVLREASPLLVKKCENESDSKITEGN